MLRSLFRTKSIDSLVKNADLSADDIHAHGLKRVLGVRDLTFFGIAAIIGAGSFSSLGAAVNAGGPGVGLLFVICGIACGFLLAAIHHAGLAALTHTPSPMNFLSKVLNRPENEKPYLVIPVGYPADECWVPDLQRKSIDKIAAWY